MTTLAKELLIQAIESRYIQGLISLEDAIDTINDIRENL